MEETDRQISLILKYPCLCDKPMYIKRYINVRIKVKDTRPNSISPKKGDFFQSDLVMLGACKGLC